MPAAYFIASISVNDAERFKRYASRTPPTIVAYGGEYLARGAVTHALEGRPPNRPTRRPRQRCFRLADRAWFSSLVPAR